MADLSAGQDDLKRTLEESRNSLALLDAALASQGQSPDENVLTMRRELEADIAVIEGLLKSENEAADDGEHEEEPEDTQHPGDVAAQQHTSADTKTTSQQCSIIGRTCVFNAHGKKTYGKITKLKLE
eukprot:Selendium_serpulae@DN6155_c0_g1_i1.p1